MIHGDKAADYGAMKHAINERKRRCQLACRKPIMDRKVLVSAERPLTRVINVNFRDVTQPRGQ